MSTTLQPLTTFPLFPLLPEDLRFKIWTFASNAPRILEICQLATQSNITEHHDVDRGIYYINASPYYSPSPVPAILHACHESRVVGLKFFKFAFGNGVGAKDENGVKKAEARIWFNALADTLYFPSWCWQNGIEPWEAGVGIHGRQQVQSVALDCTMWYSPDLEDEPGSLNGRHIQVDSYGDLGELVWVERAGEKCGCCMEWDGEETGEVRFEAIGEEERRRKFWVKVEMDTREVFEDIRKRNGRWRVPELRFVKLLRDGVPH